MSRVMQGLLPLITAASAKLAAAGLSVADEPAAEGETVWRLELEQASAGSVEGEAVAILSIWHETAEYQGLTPGLTGLSAAAAALDRKRLVAGGLLAVPIWQGVEFNRDALNGRRLSVLRFRLLIQAEG